MLIRAMAFAFLFFLSLTSISAEEWPRVYLATYPRSGNHWMRYLIEEATHIATSSVYKDPREGTNIIHLSKTFPWGGFCANHGYQHDCRYPLPGESVVIKTHSPALRSYRFDHQPYTKAITIVRHPIDSIYSWHLYRHAFVWCKPAPSRIPTNALVKYIYLWKKFHRYWSQFPNTILIRYEDLCDKPADFLKMVLNEIGYAFSEEDIMRAVTKFPPKGEELKYLKNYTPEDLRLIARELGPLMKQFKYTIPQQNFRR